ncbi:MAG: phosphatidylserine decarboxylase [Nevskia sp.]|nr:phosphatidylserine decarboxylase [Nevskia sp.]
MSAEPAPAPAPPPAPEPGPAPAAAAAPLASRRDRWFARLQQRLPAAALDNLAFRLANIRNRIVRELLIRLFVEAYEVDLKEAEFDEIGKYGSFNAFFTRALKPGARPLPADPQLLVSPADGCISQIGPVRDGSLVQAKGIDYTVADLLTDPSLAASFRDGTFCTIYLAPRDYHRVHMPCAGSLRQWSYVPGRLFSVNASTARAVPGLFSRNERIVAVFDTAFGPLALVMVGALLVGGIETVWHGRVTPPHAQDGAPAHYAPMHPVRLERGAEMGRFMMGSTVILLAPAGALGWDAELGPERVVRMGEELATMLRKRPPA